MTISKPLSLRYWPEACLRGVCADCCCSSEERKRIGTKMLKIMFDNCGYGLAAPQVGLDCRIFVMRDPHNTSRGLIFVNPEIVELGSTKINDTEGCLSLLGQRTFVERASSIEFEFDDLDNPGQRLHWRFEGLNARCVQHEIDHLNGIMIFDHIKSTIARKMFLDRYGKARKKHDRIG